MAEKFDNLTELARLSKLVDKLLNARDRVEALEDELKRAKLIAEDLEEYQIPEIMEALGLEQIRTQSGFDVKLETVPTASITRERADAAHAWLEEHGHGGMIKNTVSVAFSRDQNEEAKALARELAEEFEYVEQKRKVEGATLLGWVRGQLAEGAAIPLDLFGVYFTKRIKVK